MLAFAYLFARASTLFRARLHACASTRYPWQLVGARVSAHIFSMVLVMVKYNSSLGLGVLTSMIWIDIFYLCLFAMIAFGLVETILVHCTLPIQTTQL